MDNMRVLLLGMRLSGLLLSLPPFKVLGLNFRNTTLQSPASCEKKAIDKLGLSGSAC